MMANIAKIVCCLVYVVAELVNASPVSKLPKGFIQCKKSDPYMDECIRDALQKAVPHLAKGIPSLGLIRMDPLRITQLIIEQGTQSIKLKLNITNLDIFNMTSIYIKKINYDLEKDVLTAHLEPQKSIVLDGMYETNGKVLIMPIVGKGKCRFALDNFKATAVVQLKKVNKNGVIYLEVVDIVWKFTTTKLHIKLENLFNGDKALGDNMNVFLNENWNELLIDMRPAIEEAFKLAFIEIGHQFLRRIPFNQIFLD